MDLLLAAGLFDKFTIFFKNFILRHLVLLYLKVMGFGSGLLRSAPENRYSFKHRTAIRTGITCKKIPCYMHDSAYSWFIVQKAKIFLSYVKHF